MTMQGLKKSGVYKGYLEEYGYVYEVNGELYAVKSNIITNVTGQVIA